jgi:hypothetical protein
LAEPWADTSASTGRLMIAVLGGLADVERAEAEHMVQPDSMSDDLGGKAMAVVRVR